MILRFIIHNCYLIIFLVLILIYNPNSFADIINDEGSFLSANTIEHHDELSMISAVGDVEVVNGSEILRANEITYDLLEDVIFAKGNVSLKSKEVDVFYAETLELKGDLKKGLRKIVETYKIDCLLIHNQTHLYF